MSTASSGAADADDQRVLHPGREDAVVERHDHVEVAQRVLERQAASDEDAAGDLPDGVLLAEAHQDEGDDRHGEDEGRAGQGADAAGPGTGSSASSPRGGTAVLLEALLMVGVPQRSSANRPLRRTIHRPRPSEIMSRITDIAAAAPVSRIWYAYV